MKIETEKEGLSIVLLGNFNPKICRPSWLYKYGLISETEQTGVTVKIQNPEVAMYEFENYQLQILKDRFSIEGPSAYDFKIYDFVIKLFSEYLPHTPCTKLGINYSAHYDIGSNEKRMALGRKLAPLTPWGEWGETIASKKPEESSGVSNITMKEMMPEGRESGHRQVTVAPSNIFEKNKIGVFVQVNDEYSLTEKQIETEDHSAKNLMVILEHDFEKSINNSKKLISTVMEMVDDV